MNRIVEAIALKASEAEVRMVKLLSLAYFKEEEKSILEIVPNCAKATLQAIIRGKVDPDSVIHSDSWRGYNGLVALGYKKHYRVHHGKNEFANKKTHINGIESFWSFAKRRLMKFHGVPQSTFYLHLKESEFRYNYRNENIYTMLLNMIRVNPLF